MDQQNDSNERRPQITRKYLAKGDKSTFAIKYIKKMSTRLRGRAIFLAVLRWNQYGAL